MIPSAPLVVKLGGSLYDRVIDLAPILARSARPLLIVPGGGKFADAIRAAELPADDAHWEAIQAMDRYGAYISTFGIPVTKRLAVPEKTTVLLPYTPTRKRDPLPHSWDITSDTIAAWVAKILGLDLLILKSVDGIRLHGHIETIIRAPVQTDVVDPCCIPYILKTNLRAVIINGAQPDTVARFLNGERVPGTWIGTTF